MRSIVIEKVDSQLKKGGSNGFYQETWTKQSQTNYEEISCWTVV